MKRTFFVLLILFVSGKTFATEQVPDILFYENLGLSLSTGWGHPSPLETYYHQNNLEYPFPWLSTANYRGHIAVWEIVDSNLYLTEILIEDYVPNESDPNVFEFGIGSYEPNEYGVEPYSCPPSENGDVFADWFSGILDCYLVSEGSYYTYLFHVREGVVVDVQIISRQDYEIIYNSPVDKLSYELERKAYMLLLNDNYITYYFRLSEDDEIEYEERNCRLNTGWVRLSPIFGRYGCSHLNWPYNWENTYKSGAPHCKWLIRDGKLYLTGVELYSGLSLYSIDTETLDLTTLFDDEVIDGAICADWVSGVYVIKHGYVTEEYAGWPGLTFTVFNVTRFTYIRIEEGQLKESYTVPKDFDPENLPEDTDPGLKQIIEDYKLPTIQNTPYERDATYFLFSTQSLIVPEAGTAKFTVALAEAPSEVIEVTVAYYSGDRDITVESEGLLTFDTSNYSIPQTITLAAAEDSDNINGIAQIRIGTHNLFDYVKVTEADNEPGAGVLFVDDDALGSNDGSSWTDAYTNLQDALNLAADTGVQEIRVAQGIYRPDRGGRNFPRNRTATFQLINGVVIKGGFAGVSEADPDIRDIKIYETILSGDLNGDDIEVSDPHDLRYEPTRADNSIHVVTSKGADGTTLIDGFTITGGNAGYSNGAGMYNIDGSPTIANCMFTGNSASLSGGGMYNDAHSSPTLTKCTFSGNSARFFGGGMKNYNESSPTLINCTFSGNSAEDGGGMYNTGSSPRLKQCVFTGNEAIGNGGALVDIGYQESTVLSQCTFTGNTAEYGGAIWIDEQSSILSNCTFSGNVARQGGGAIYCWDASIMTLTNCILWDNLPREIEKTPTSVMPKVYHSDVKSGWTDRGDSNIDVDPCFADPGYWDPNGTPDDANDDFWIDGDYHLKSKAGRYDPNTQTWVKDDVTSPCIDAGDMGSPIGYEPFPNGGVINMGAYGGTTEASKSYFGGPVCETIVAGDINGDCKVDFSDFAIMALHWLEDNNSW